MNKAIANAWAQDQKIRAEKLVDNESDIVDVTDDLEFTVHRLVRDELAKFKKNGFDTIGGDALDSIMSANLHIKEIVKRAHELAQ